MLHSTQIEIVNAMQMQHYQATTNCREIKTIGN